MGTPKEVFISLILDAGYGDDHNFGEVEFML